MLSDLKYALRSLIRSPLFTAGIVVTLALGIGANATMFGVVDVLFLRPPAGVQDAGALRRIYFRRAVGDRPAYTGPTTNYPAFKDLAAGVSGFTSVSAMTMPRDISLGRGEDARSVKAALVSHTWFSMLGVRAAEGRLFDENDDRLGAPTVAVLSWDFWQRHYGGDLSVLGRSVNLGRANYTIIGVTPEAFNGIELQPVDVWLPIEASAEAVMGTRDAVESRGWWWMQVLGRLRPGVTAEQVEAQATMAFRNGMRNDNRGADSTSTVVLGAIQQARAPNAGKDSKVSAWIGAVALVVLLIACANVANLLLARGVARRRELAVRAGLGAGRGGLMRLLLAESLVLAALGGTAAIAVTVWSGQALRKLLLPDLPASVPVIDPRVLGFTAAAILVTSLLAGFVPAFQSSRTDVADTLKSGGHGTTSRGGRTRAVLLAAQVALTVVLLAGAGLFVRSLRNVQAIDLGFDADRTLSTSVSLAALNIEGAEANALYLRLVDRVKRLPGVEEAAASMGVPFGSSRANSLRVSNRDSLPDLPSGGPYFQVITPSYMTTMGSSIVKGRDISEGDAAGSEKVALVNEYLARMVWPGQEPLGQCLYHGDDPVCRRVVGVVEDARRWGIIDETSAMYYLPLSQYADAEMDAMMVRSRTTAAAIAAAVRREIQAAGNLPYPRVQPLADQVAPHLRSWRLGAGAFSAFGLLALVIAATGIFAVISYSVTQRTREIGVRIALGATAREVMRTVLRHGLAACVAGLVAGAGGAWLLGRSIASLLYGVEPADPVVFGGVVFVLLTAAAVAALLPARRAARVDPMIALRSE